MTRIARTWIPVGLVLLTLTVSTGCQISGSPSLGLKKPETAIEHSMKDVDSTEQPHRLAAASEPGGGTSIEGMPGRKQRAPARRALFRSSSCST